MYAKDVQLVLLHHPPSPPPPPCMDIVVPISGPTNGDVQWVGRKHFAKHVCSTNIKQENHVRQLRSITCPKIYL